MPEKETLPLSKIEHNKISKNHLILVFIICVTLIIIFYFMFSNSKSGNVIQESKKDCPYECCLEGNYNLKNCDNLYECLNNNCKPIDSDKDGLTDLEENNIRTNPQMDDTDGDTLSDYQEYKILGTNPLNSNTDNDRYNDNEDENPLITNSAKIVVSKSNEEGDYHWGNLIKDGIVVGGASALLGGCSVGTMGACAAAVPALYSALNPILDDVIYTSNVDIIFTNHGSDYTSFIDYNIIYSIGDVELLNIPETSKRLNTGESITIPHTYEIKLKDIRYGSTWNLILGRNKINIEIDNLDYEQY